MSHETYMKVAIEEARAAKERGDYGMGAVVVNSRYNVVAAGGNRVKTMNDSTRHVELEVIRYAKGATHERYLTGHTLYTTCFPCVLCAGAAYWAGIDKIVYGISQGDLMMYGVSHGTDTHRYRPSPLDLSFHVVDGKLWGMSVEQVMRDECLEALR